MGSISIQTFHTKTIWPIDGVLKPGAKGVNIPLFNILARRLGSVTLVNVHIRIGYDHTHLMILI